ncbi:MAG: hypothetical protein ACK5JT_03435 [Hyphomicrobiaceae bacterium]
MRKLILGTMAVLFAFAVARTAAYAGTDTIAYQPGVIKAALAKGETVLIHYKSTW